MDSTNKLTQHYTRGLSLIEVIFVAAVVTVFFVGLIAGFRYTLDLVMISKTKQSALSVALNSLEYVHSLSFDALGTEGGIPSGNIPQVATTSLNGIEFTVDTLVEYIDSPADGEAGDDENGIVADYKQAKVTVSWQYRDVPYSIALQSLIIPRSIETDVGGGTLRVNVFDANIAPLANASVRVINNSVSPAIDVTKTTNASGVALFSGAPALAGYEIIVTKAGYSVDATHDITTELANPNTLPATVAEADVTTMNFFIDEVSNLLVKTITGQTVDTWEETFATSTAIATSTDVVVGGGVLALYDSGSGFVSTGAMRSTPITPGTIESWGTLNVIEVLPFGTARIIQFYDASASTTTLIPDTDLPGNSVGFGDTTMDLSTLDSSVYPSIVIGIVLQTASSTVTPAIDNLLLSYVATESSIGGVSLSVYGNKILGTDAALSPVYKYAVSTTTSGSGERLLSNLEWDTYDVTAGGYTIVEACPQLPYTVNPGVDKTLVLTLSSSVAHSLRVSVVDATENAVANALVRLSRAGYTHEETSSICGQVFFNAPGDFDDYLLEVEVNGSVVFSQASTTINGTATEVVELP